MKPLILFPVGLFILLLSAVTAFAQYEPESAVRQCSLSKSGAWRAAAKVTVADAAEDAYDIKYVKLDLTVPNTGATVRGIATTRAQVLATNLTEYVFELNSGMTVDSVRINGVGLPWSIGPGIRRVALPAALPQGSLFTVEVGYHGTAVGNLAGLRGAVVGGSSDRATYTLSESYEARDWWPCKQSLTDKIDSSDVWLTVPSNCKGGSNGLLTAITFLPGSLNRYEWQSRYPIDYYLISLSVSPYYEYTFYTHFSPTDSMPVQNYLYNSLQLTPTLKTTLDSTGPYIQFLSGLFGRYPFWQEKYGHCLAPLGGGMEHQTMTTLGYIEGYLLVHELGHQWWGDDVTCGSWHDIWLNEGFATYCEYLYAGHFRSTTAASNRMLAWHNDVLSDPGGSVYVVDTTDEARMFSGRLTYNKGAAVLHSLRFEAGSDSLFFAMIRQYRQQHHFGTALSSDLKTVASQVYGRSMDTFFNQWIYGEGYPTISAEWNKIGDTVYLRLRQAASSPSSVFTFSTPLEVRFFSLLGDTTVRLQLSNEEQDYRFVISRQVSDLVIDPNNWIINKTGTIIRNARLGWQDFSYSRLRLAPNPSRSSWTVSNLPEASRIMLWDLNGKLLRDYGGNKQISITIDGSQLPAGTYLLTVRPPGDETFVTRLVKE